MPRHPPCALKNLTTKIKNKKHSREPQKLPRTPKRAHEPDPGSYSWKLLLIQDARVHYVVLKQQPHTTHPTHTCVDRHGRETRNKQTHQNTTHTPKGEDSEPVALLPQDPTVCQTQKPPHHHAHRSRTTTKAGFVLGKDTTTQRPLFVDIPPMST